MASRSGDFGLEDLADRATYQRLAKDVSAVKDDISALTDQIGDVIRSLAGSAKKQARASMDSAVDDASDRGSAFIDAAQDAARSIEETLEDVIAERPLAAVGLAIGVGFLIGATWRR